MNRRNFIQHGSALSAGVLLVSPKTAFGFEANEKIKLGFIGCGGRGTFVADIFKEHGKFEFAAAGDYFEDTVKTFGDAYAVPADQRFTGLDNYKKVIAASVDAVVIHSPPWFHPSHTAAAVEAGKHVLLAKPIAVDVPGTVSVEETAKKAAEKNLAVMVDFQSRGDTFFQEALARVKNGALGEFCFGECNYEADTLPAKAPGDSPEERLKNWVFWKNLSGDIITEQAIHALDIVSWALGQPLKATGMRGRRVRTNVGDTSDHYSVLFEFPTGGVNFHCRQFSAWGVPFICANRHFGTKGALFTDFGGRVMIRGNSDTAYAGGTSKDLYKSGSVANVKVWHENILAGKGDISTVPPSAQTNLLTILGRTAAELGRTVTFEEMIKAATPFEVDLSGLKA